MKITKVEIGDRYSDDSGWERRIEVNNRTKEVILEIGSKEINFSIDELDWLNSSIVEIIDIFQN